MKWTGFAALAVSASAMLSAVAIAAQPPGPGHPPPGPPGGFVPGGPMGFFETAGGPGEKRIEGAPYQARFSSELVQTLADGNRIVQRSRGHVARDAAGRTRREQVVEAETRGVVFIEDPVAEARYVLFADRQVAHALQWRGPGRFEVVRRHGEPRPTPKSESLGRQTIGGVEAEGTRETLTIPAGTSGNEKALEIVSERWYSPELQVVVLSRRRDPRHGETTQALTDITRGEPDAALFELADGYAIEEPGADRFGADGRPPAGPVRLRR